MSKSTFTSDAARMAAKRDAGRNIGPIPRPSPIPSDASLLDLVDAAAIRLRQLTGAQRAEALRVLYRHVYEAAHEIDLIAARPARRRQKRLSV